MFTIARNANQKFNPDKLQLTKSSINYLWLIILDKGVEPDPKKVDAIIGFSTPSCRVDIQYFLGFMTYQEKFTPHLSILTHGLRQLMKKNTPWIWDANTQ